MRCRFLLLFMRRTFQQPACQPAHRGGRGHDHDPGNQDAHQHGHQDDGPGLISRAIVLVSMLVGVLVAGIVIVTATTTVGWLAGRLLEGSTAQEEQKEAAAHK